MICAASSHGPATHFRAAFLDALGALIQTVPISAETVTVATSRAAEIAGEIAACDFYITSERRRPINPLDRSPSMD